MTGQFDPVGEISDEKEDKLSQVRFTLPQGLILDAASNKIEEQFREKGEEHKKGLETYTLWKVLSQKSWPTEKKKVKLAKWNEGQPIEKNRIEQINSGEK
ncbi:15855_t:CDS:1 [Cetraspora pellucida]|uniref:15855_t:CDS:1 n=1 Tax=Cetraspora pellucida TaxID=1433469 RepID=A0A9N9DCL2_9GLOM|nr:15855_t:CDS:1 [Cetraspora pellucida]